MTREKADACGHDSGTSDAFAPMRRWEGGMPSGGYATGQTEATADAAPGEAEATDDAAAKAPPR